MRWRGAFVRRRPPPAVRKLGLLPAIALCFAASLDGRSQTAKPHSIEALLDRYAAGRHVEVVAELMSAPSIRDIRDQLEDRGESWTSAAGPGEAPRRRLVAATLALDLTTFYLWPEAIDPLVEWGCRLIRKPGRLAGEADRLWFRASVAILSRTRDDGRLVTRAGPGVPLGQRILPASRDLDHLDHARQRYPDEPRFALTEAMLASAVADAEPPRDIPWVEDARLDRQSFEAIRRSRARRAIGMFEPLRAVPAIAFESDLRIGYLKITLRQFDEAVPYVERAAQSEDPFVAYLGRLLAGRAFERMGDRAQAARSYRLALGVLPHTQSASQALAALVLEAGQADEAFRLAARTLEARPRAEDPWHVFGYGDLRFVPGLLWRLREALR